MTNLKNGVDIQGMGNTIDLTTVMNLYTSSFKESFKEGFTEGFLKVLENYNTPLQEIVEVKNDVKPIKKPTSKSKSKNKGFEKLKGQLLREKLQKCNRVKYNPNTHVKVKDFKYKSIYELDSLSKKKWVKYFLKGKVYIDKDVTSKKISQRILFDKSITEFFGKNETSTK